MGLGSSVHATLLFSSTCIHAFMLLCCHFSCSTYVHATLLPLSCSTYVHVTQLPVLLHFHSEVRVVWGGVMTLMLPCFSLAFHTYVHATLLPLSCSTYVHATLLPVLLHFHSEVRVGWGGVMTLMLPCFSLAFHTYVHATLLPLSCSTYVHATLLPVLLHFHREGGVG